MRTIRLLYPGLATKRIGHKLAIRDDQQLKHLTVLKAAPENYLYEVGDGKGNVASVTLLKLTNEGALFKLNSFITSNASSLVGRYKPSRFLCMPIIRFPLLEQALAQVTQLNFYEQINLYFSDFTRYTKREFSDNKLLRLKKIITNSYSQSKSAVKPELHLNGNLKNALGNTYLEPNSFVFAPHTGTESLSLSRLSDFIDAADNIITVIGPEGGFSSAEILTITTTPLHYMPYLGNSILTSETAVVLFSGLLLAVTKS